MESQQQKEQAELNREQVHKNLKLINHFGYQIALPQATSIFTYQPKHISESKKKKKLKHKFDHFTYYQDNDTKATYKVLFLSDDIFVDQGVDPFTDPSGQARKFTQLNVKRLKVTEAAYIGHVGEELIVKKMEGVKLGENGTQFETVDDNFQVIKLGNQKRFNQFMKLMNINKNAISMSIRVIVDQTGPHQPKVIDYEFFYRENQLIKKHSQNNASK